MGKLKLSGKDLRAIGYPESPVISLAMDIMEKNYKRNSKEYALGLLKSVLVKTHEYAEDEILGRIAQALIEREQKAAAKAASTFELKPEGVPYNIFGAEFIEEGALTQMNNAVRLPISVSGALMPDAHQGYGLPIGGVLATENAVIPYGVGVDIGCRMCLSVFDIDPKELEFRESYFTRELNENTLFGSGREFKKRTDHEILYRKEFSEIPILRTLRDRAESQLGSSGGGNHFAEFGTVDISEKDPVLGIEPGKYFGLLSHSGSRAIGANVANHYTKLAKDKRRLPPDAANLAWLTLDEQEGIEYWLAMNLAGDYASACHHVIHEKIAKQLGRVPLKMVENHHNFAWKETWEGKEVIVHRKGATPAGKDVLGIIPGSMTAPGFIVKGKGENASVNSASHGAGRKMSRTSAIDNITAKQLKEELEKHGVKLIGGGLDEAPFAYKDINIVMNAQKHLVETLGTFTPKIVKMDDTPPRQRKKVKEVMGE
ncbi:MAG TPA: RtcB family protein [Segetibacter sp.]|nr:RtcB family protein [Segetibacter sp.]